MTSSIKSSLYFGAISTVHDTKILSNVPTSVKSDKIIYQKALLNTELHEPSKTSDSLLHTGHRESLSNMQEMVIETNLVTVRERGIGSDLARSCV